MHIAHRLVALGIAWVLASPATGVAQTTDATPSSEALPTIELPLPHDRIERTGFWTWFEAVPNDFRRFVSRRTANILGVGGAAALGAYQWDDEGIEMSQEHLRPALFRAGNVGGGFLMQGGASAAMYSIARWAGADSVASMASDLIRGHVLSQGVVQAGKVATGRTRPDASNNHSLPSGHTAAAFTTAAVLGHHYGGGIGIAAYSFGAYVAASRMAANRHHLSDVVLGAAVGIAAGRTVTLGPGAARFDVGVTPVPGGVALTLTAAPSRE
jgi:hypothetical protein